MSPAQGGTVLRVLYVEDDTDTREMVSFSLASLTPACIVTGVETCAEGLLAARANRFDLFMIDSRLPDGIGIGIDLCRQIRAFDKKTPIIFCSGFTDDSHRRTAMNCGATLFPRQAL